MKNSPTYPGGDHRLVKEYHNTGFHGRYDLELFLVGSECTTAVRLIAMRCYFQSGGSDSKDVASHDGDLSTDLSIDGKGLTAGNSSAVDGGQVEKGMTNDDLKPNGNSDLCARACSY